MTYVIATIKRLGDNEMVVVDATNPPEFQCYIIDDKTELTERQLYQIEGKVINDRMEYNGLNANLQALSTKKYKELYDLAEKQGCITKEKSIRIIPQKEELIEAEVIEEPISLSKPVAATPYTNSVSSGNVVKKDEIILAPVSGLPSMAEVDEYFKRYEYTKKTIIGPNDYHEYSQGGKKKSFLKKSGFRKFIHAFGLKTDIVNIQNRLYAHTFNNGTVKQGIEYEVMAKVIAPNGQYTVNVAICQQYEKGGNRTKHDILATATTRAINRAISDLVAFGEVSYEEL